MAILTHYINSQVQKILNYGIWVYAILKDGQGLFSFLIELVKYSTPSKIFALQYSYITAY